MDRPSFASAERRHGDRRVRRRGLVLADRVALVALVGIAVSVATWVAFAYVDASVLLKGTLQEELISPQPEQTLMRLGTVVLVLVGTLVVQVIYSRRIQAEERLRVAEAQVLEMYENTPDAVLCIRRDCRIVYANPASRRLAGNDGDPRGLIGELCYASLWGREQPCVGCLVGDVVATAEVRNRTLSDTSSGTARYIEQILYPVFDASGEVESVVESSRDTTERVLAQQAIQDLAHDDAAARHEHATRVAYLL